MSENEIELPQMHCSRCGHDWIPRVSHPKKCPNCKSKKWDQPAEGGQPDIQNELLQEYFNQYLQLRDAIEQSGGRYSRDIVKTWAKPRAKNLDMDPSKLINQMEQKYALL